MIDFGKQELYFLGPGDYELASMLPPGTDDFKLEEAPSGHLVLPCSEFSVDAGKAPSSSLTLIARTVSPAGKPPPADAPEVTTQAPPVPSPPPGIAA